MSDKFKNVTEAQLKDYIKTIFLEVGLPENDASIVSNLMTEADMLGVDTHGVFRLPQYVKRLIAGGINKTPNISIVREKSAMALLMAIMQWVI
jgi:LDH2 family malate/lactate/ureidoglycolate dehydrogenase